MVVHDLHDSDRRDAPQVGAAIRASSRLHLNWLEDQAVGSPQVKRVLPCTVGREGVTPPRDVRHVSESVGRHERFKPALQDLPICAPVLPPAPITGAVLLQLAVRELDFDHSPP